MTRNDIIRMALDAGIFWSTHQAATLERFAALVAAAERNKVAQWMMAKGYATGHGDTTEDLLDELDWQITESWSKVVVASVEAEREACAKVCEDNWHIDGSATAGQFATAIRARGQT